MSEQQLPTGKKNNQLLQYAGLTIQFFVAIGLGIFIGYKIDKWQQFSTPVFLWVLPLLIIGAIIFKVIKDTAPKKKK